MRDRRVILRVRTVRLSTLFPPELLVESHDVGWVERVRRAMRRAASALTIHNIPEGLSVGLVLAAGGI